MVEHAISTGDRHRERIAVFFDMDGTLLDSEKLWSVGLHDLALRYGARLDPVTRAHITGTSLETAMRILHCGIGQPNRDINESAAWLSKRMEELFLTRLRWQPGAERLVRAVQGAGLPTALVTTTRRHLVEPALGWMALERRFDVVVTGDDVSRPKPHPAPYSLAAQRVGLDAGSCVALEDSRVGVESARAAGCQVVLVRADQDGTRGGDQSNELPEDVVRVPSLLEVGVPLLRRIAARTAAVRARP
jgi:HAD superfamily hydrolase (TIGR01509 family)